MPKKVKHPCLYPGCPALVDRGYCDRHQSFAPQRPVDTRPSAHTRGYTKEWWRIRAEVLRKAGIPTTDWQLYDVDHNPPYDQRIEPDHRKYQLIPRLHAEHSAKTCREDGGFGIKKKAQSGPGGGGI